MDRHREDALVALLAGLAERIAAAAPKGWKRAALHGYALGDGASGHEGITFAPDDRSAGEIDVHEGLCAIHTLLEATERLTIDLELEARGRFRAVLSERLQRADRRGFRYVLDADSEPPPLDVPGSVAGEAGDPDEAVALINEYHQLLHQVLEVHPELPPSVEVPPGLPRDLAALYATYDGDGGFGQLHGFCWFDSETLLELSAERWWVRRGWRRYGEPPAIDFGPPGAVRRVHDHPGWIPFATDTFGDFLAVDMAPGPNGRRGQVIVIGRHRDDGPVYVADSVTALLRTHVDTLRAGRVEHDEDGRLWTDSGDAYHFERRYDEACRLTVSGRDAGPIRGLTDETRELVVHDAPWVDLAPVRGTPLARLSVRNCAGLDLSPLRETQLELLELAVDTIDLSGLQGHPALGHVVLRSEKPVDLRPLASCPNLHTLDVAEAPAADGLDHLSGLRYLRMLRPQWQVFPKFPKTLSVAELAAEPLQERKFYWSFDKAYEKRRPTMDDALAWADGLGGEVVTIKGRFRR
ncbi:SMI1/KNR4 family protein [Kribbella sp. WER1]